MSSRRYEHCQIWDYWAKHATGWGPIKPYHWQAGENEREAWVQTQVRIAREMARIRVRHEVATRAWWVPPSFTVEDFDALRY